MAHKRNRIIELKNYLESFGIKINIGKTKARGNKGIFLAQNDTGRIDIAKNQDEESIFSVMIHEFAHYIHYKYDKSLNSYAFLFPDFNEEMLDELLKVSVECVPKEYAASIFDRKAELLKEISLLSDKIKEVYPDFVISKPYLPILKDMHFTEKYFLKYDRVKIFNKLYTIDDLDVSDIHINYLRLKSKQRQLKRLNSTINKINKYYNKPTELLSRFVELYFTDNEKVQKLAPICYEKMAECLQSGKIPEISGLNNFVLK